MWQAGRNVVDVEFGLIFEHACVREHGVTDLFVLSVLGVVAIYGFCLFKEKKQNETNVSIDSNMQVAVGFSDQVFVCFHYFLAVDPNVTFLYECIHMGLRMPVCPG